MLHFSGQNSAKRWGVTLDDTPEVLTLAIPLVVLLLGVCSWHQDAVCCFIGIQEPVWSPTTDLMFSGYNCVFPSKVYRYLICQCGYMLSLLGFLVCSPAGARSHYGAWWNWHGLAICGVTDCSRTKMSPPKELQVALDLFSFCCSQKYVFPTHFMNIFWLWTGRQGSTYVFKKIACWCSYSNMPYLMCKCQCNSWTGS